MQMPAETRPDTISFHDVTYVIKSVTSSQLIAFNGSRYLIVSRSKSIIITTLVKSRVKSDQAAEFLLKIVEHLVKQNYWVLMSVLFMANNLNNDFSWLETLHPGTADWGPFY